MNRKVVNIKHAKIDRNKPILSMSRRERKETFHDLGGSIYEGMLADARASDQPVQLISVVLSKDGMLDRLVCTYEEYGDKDHVEMCNKLSTELTPFLHEGERLRVATFNVDLNKLSSFTFPSKTTWHGRQNSNKEDDEKWLRYEWLYEARGLVTLIITRLIGPAGLRRVFTWDVDHGDGCAMFENVIDTIEGVKWNKLLGRGERLEVISYTVPPDALCEIPKG